MSGPDDDKTTGAARPPVPPRRPAARAARSPRAPARGG